MFFGEPDGTLNPEVFTKGEELIGDISVPWGTAREEYDRALTECLNSNKQLLSLNCSQQAGEQLIQWLKPAVEEWEAAIKNLSQNQIETLILEGKKENLWRGITDAKTAELDCEGAAEAAVESIVNNANSL
jgi:hypothetical protein